MFVALLERLRRFEDLTSEDAAAAMGRIMDGEAQPSQIAALLMGLALKGERPSEMVGFARAMRERAVRLPGAAGDVFDTCGTGGDGANTFNVSTATALVLAGAGVRIAKHGNRAASSRSGSADVFEALGVNLEAPRRDLGDVQHLIDEMPEMRREAAVGDRRAHHVVRLLEIDDQKSAGSPNHERRLAPQAFPGHVDFLNRSRSSAASPEQCRSNQSASRS